MHERLSFHIKRDSFIHNLNPLTKLVLTLTLILIAFHISLVLDASPAGACCHHPIESDGQSVS
jgi:hypothetical protein